MRREEKRREEEDQRRDRQKKEDPGVRKGRKVAKPCVFPMFCGPGGSTSRLAKAAGAEPSGQMRDEKLHAVVARSTFRSQHVQNTPAPDHVWKLRCQKSARRCGAKHISKWKCTKHTSSGPRLEVAMSKKCTPLWREAHLEVKMYKTHHSQTTFGSWGVEKVHAVVARSSDHFWKLTCRKSVHRCGAKHISKSKVLKTYGLGALLEVNMSKKCTPLWCEAHFEVKMLKTPHVRTTFGRSDVVSHGRRRSILDRWSGKIANALARGRQLCIQLSIFEVSLAELLRFWHCQVPIWGSLADLFRSWCCQVQKSGSLAALFRFWRCQVQTLRKSRRIAAFFKLADRQIDR